MEIEGKFFIAPVCPEFADKPSTPFSLHPHKMPDIGGITQKIMLDMPTLQIMALIPRTSQIVNKFVFKGYLFSYPFTVFNTVEFVEEIVFY